MSSGTSYSSKRRPGSILRSRERVSAAIARVHARQLGTSDTNTQQQNVLSPQNGEREKKSFHSTKSPMISPRHLPSSSPRCLPKLSVATLHAGGNSQARENPNNVASPSRTPLVPMTQSSMPVDSSYQTRALSVSPDGQASAADTGNRSPHQSFFFDVFASRANPPPPQLPSSDPSSSSVNQENDNPTPTHKSPSSAIQPNFSPPSNAQVNQQHASPQKKYSPRSSLRRSSRRSPRHSRRSSSAHVSGVQSTETMTQVAQQTIVPSMSSDLEDAVDSITLEHVSKYIDSVEKMHHKAEQVTIESTQQQQVDLQYQYRDLDMESNAALGETSESGFVSVSDSSLQVNPGMEAESNEENSLPSQHTELIPFDEKAVTDTSELSENFSFNIAAPSVDNEVDKFLAEEVHKIEQRMLSNIQAFYSEAPNKLDPPDDYSKMGDPPEGIGSVPLKSNTAISENEVAPDPPVYQSFSGDKKLSFSDDHKLSFSDDNNLSFSDDHKLYDEETDYDENYTNGSRAEIFSSTDISEHAVAPDQQYPEQELQEKNSGIFSDMTDQEIPPQHYGEDILSSASEITSSVIQPIDAWNGMNVNESHAFSHPNSSEHIDITSPTEVKSPGKRSTALWSEQPIPQQKISMKNGEVSLLSDLSSQEFSGVNVSERCKEIESSGRPKPETPRKSNSSHSSSRTHLLKQNNPKVSTKCPKTAKSPRPNPELELRYETARKNKSQVCPEMSPKPEMRVRGSLSNSNRLEFYTTGMDEHRSPGYSPFKTRHSSSDERQTQSEEEQEFQGKNSAVKPSDENKAYNIAAQSLKGSEGQERVCSDLELEVTTFDDSTVQEQKFINLMTGGNARNKIENQNLIEQKQALMLPKLVYSENDAFQTGEEQKELVESAKAVVDKFLSQEKQRKNIRGNGNESKCVDDELSLEDGKHVAALIEDEFTDEGHDVSLNDIPSQKNKILADIEESCLNEWTSASSIAESSLSLAHTSNIASSKVKEFDHGDDSTEDYLPEKEKQRIGTRSDKPNVKCIALTDQSDSVSFESVPELACQTGSDKIDPSGKKQKNVHVKKTNDPYGKHTLSSYDSFSEAERNHDSRKDNAELNDGDVDMLIRAFLSSSAEEQPSLELNEKKKSLAEKIAESTKDTQEKINEDIIPAKGNSPDFNSLDTENKAIDTGNKGLMNYLDKFKYAVANMKEASGFVCEQGNQLDQFVKMTTHLFDQSKPIGVIEGAVRDAATSLGVPKQLVEAILETVFHEHASSKKDIAVATALTNTADEGPIEVDYNLGLLESEHLPPHKNAPGINDSIVTSSDHTELVDVMFAPSSKDKEEVEVDLNVGLVQKSLPPSLIYGSIGSEEAIDLKRDSLKPRLNDGKESTNGITRPKQTSKEKNDRLFGELTEKVVESSEGKTFVDSINRPSPGVGWEIEGALKDLLVLKSTSTDGTISAFMDQSLRCEEGWEVEAVMKERKKLGQDFTNLQAPKDITIDYNFKAKTTIEEALAEDDSIDYGWQTEPKSSDELENKDSSDLAGDIACRADDKHNEEPSKTLSRIGEETERGKAWSEAEGGTEEKPIRIDADGWRAEDLIDESTGVDAEGWRAEDLVEGIANASLGDGASDKPFDCCELEGRISAEEVNKERFDEKDETNKADRDRYDPIIPTNADGRIENNKDCTQLPDAEIIEEAIAEKKQSESKLRPKEPVKEIGLLKESQTKMKCIDSSPSEIIEDSPWDIESACLEAEDTRYEPLAPKCNDELGSQVGEKVAGPALDTDIIGLVDSKGGHSVEDNVSPIDEVIVVSPGTSYEGDREPTSPGSMYNTCTYKTLSVDWDRKRAESCESDKQLSLTDEWCRKHPVNPALSSESGKVMSEQESSILSPSNSGGTSKSDREDWRRRHETLNKLKRMYNRVNYTGDKNKSTAGSLNQESSRRTYLGFTFNRGLHMCNQWKQSYRERTKAHPGYFNVDVYSLYDLSMAKNNAHALDAIAWENRDVRQRFLHEQSLSFSKNWFGDLKKKRGNDRVREAVSHPKSMQMPMENARPEEWTEEWFTTWKPRWQALDFENEEQSFTDASGTCNDSGIKDNGPAVLNRNTDRYASASGSSSFGEYSATSSVLTDDDEASWDDEAPECGILINVKPKIGERVTRLHHNHTSSLRRSRWRKKYFPKGSFPY